MSPATNPFETESYKRSRLFYSVFCLLQYMVALLITDAYLSKLLLALEFSDAQIGIISSLASLTFVFGFTALLAVGRIRHIRTYILVSQVLSELLFSFLFLIPVLNVPRTLRLPLVLLCLLGGFFCRYSVEAMLSKWANSYVSPDKRGDYSAYKCNMSLIGGILFTLALGFVVDKLEGRDMLAEAFILIGAIGFVCTSLTLVSLLKISRENVEIVSKKEHTPMREVLRNTFGLREYRNIVLSHLLYSSAYYLTASFMGTYKINEMAMSVGLIQVINMVGSLIRLALSRPFGKYADRTSYARAISLGLVVMSLCFVFNIFSSPSFPAGIVLYTIIMAVSMCGTTQNYENALYSYVPVKYYVQASVIKSALAGLVGFLVSLAGSALLDWVQRNGNTLFGIHCYGQQVLSVISLILTLAALGFTYFVVEKQKDMHQ